MKTIRQLIIATCLLLTWSNVKGNSFINSPQKNTITQKAYRGKINLQWTATTKNVLVIASTEEKLNVPAKGANYSASLKYGSGSIVNKGFAVYRGNESSIIVTGLQSEREYYFSIYEADANGDFIIDGPALSTFNGFYTPNKAELHIKTTVEKSNDYFVLERSDDTSPWKEIGKINFSDTSVKNGDYVFFDKALLSGTYNYRVKQPAANNKYSYSLPIEVDIFELVNVFEVASYPDIERKGQLDVLCDMDMELTITNSKGNLVKTISLNEKNNYYLTINDLPDGIYSVSGTNRRGTLTKKVSLEK